MLTGNVGWITDTLSQRYRTVSLSGTLVNSEVTSNDSILCPVMFNSFARSTNSNESLIVCRQIWFLIGVSKLHNHFAKAWYGEFTIDSMGLRGTEVKLFSDKSILWTLGNPYRRGKLQPVGFRFQATLSLMTFDLTSSLIMLFISDSMELIVGGLLLWISLNFHSSFKISVIPSKYWGRDIITMPEPLSGLCINISVSLFNWDNASRCPLVIKLLCGLTFVYWWNALTKTDLLSDYYYG